MTHIYTWIYNDLEKKKTNNSTAHTKILMERKAGAELREASMQGLVPCETLCDVAQLDDATPREKGGQQKSKKHAQSSSSDAPNTDTELEVKLL
ncbi:hypothetical protein FRC10_010342 [Ceratobasidium sp. 414]|nr:hypothetical protein FRC10_010342 [Ceratobasidium sp. 414]